MRISKTDKAAIMVKITPGIIGLNRKILGLVLVILTAMPLTGTFFSIKQINDIERVHQISCNDKKELSSVDSEFSNKIKEAKMDQLKILIVMLFVLVFIMFTVGKSMFIMIVVTETFFKDKNCRKISESDDFDSAIEYIEMMRTVIQGTRNSSNRRTVNGDIIK